MTTVTAPLDLLLDTFAGRDGLPPLDPAAYARAHHTYEAHSDQRALLAGWLAVALDAALPGPGARSIISIGPGDGSLDAPLAAGLAAGRDRLRWVAAEPNAAVGSRCRARVAAAIGADRTVLHAGTFDTLADTVGAESFDVVLAVHSLYYVPDLATALDRARTRVAPGGALVIALAPLEDLCLLTDAVDPGSHRWWSGQLAQALPTAGFSPTTGRLAGRLDVTDCFDPSSSTGREVLDFLVGADCGALDDDGRAVVLDALAAISVTEGPQRVVAHPVDVVVALPV